MGTLWGAMAPPTAAAAASHRTGQLQLPKASTAQEARYLTDVAQVDADLVTYVNSNGNVALRGMLADGLAFCGYLRRGGGIDQALVNVAEGAQADEKTTHLPLSVHTFNTLESLALIDLCPGEQRMVPQSVRAELHQLTAALRTNSSAQRSPSG
jgi:hypothetical protein